NSDHTPARCLSDRDRNSPGANGKLDQWPVSLTGKPDVERNVSAVASRRLRVSVRPSVVPVRHGRRTGETRFPPCLAERVLEARVVADGGEVFIAARLLAERREQFDGPFEVVERLVANLTRER